MREMSSGLYDLYEIKLRLGIYEQDYEQLKLYVDKMFEAWRYITNKKYSSFLKNYAGIVKRFFLDYSKERGGVEPYFYLLCLRERKDFDVTEEYKRKIEEVKLQNDTNTRWFTAWGNAIKTCLPISVSINHLEEKEAIENEINVFCTNERYTLNPIVDDEKKELLKNVCGSGRHNLVTFLGKFKELNRQLSVGCNDGN